MDGVCGSNEEKRNAYKVLVWKTAGKSPLERPRCRWEYNIKPDIKGNGSGYGKMTGCFERGNERSDSIIYGEFLDQVGKYVTCCNQDSAARWQPTLRK
jgi:hypothetical protein